MLSLRFAAIAGVIAVVASTSVMRLGANLGWLKFTDSPTWNPF